MEDEAMIQTRRKILISTQVAGLAGAQDYCRRPPGAAKVVYYTAREPVDMRHLGELSGGRWPADHAFVYHDDDAMLASMKSLDVPLAAAGVPGAAKAFETLRPGAFKADLWRYAILWGCGGIYVDSKMRLVSDWADFIENSQRQFGFSFESREPALLTCLDRGGSKDDRYHATTVWQGFLVANARHPDLLRAIAKIVENVDKKFYSDEKLSPWLTITGPVMLSRVILEKPDWRRRVHLACHEGSPHPKDGRLDLDPRGRVQCRFGEAAPHVPPCAWHGGAVALKQTELRITWGDGRQKLMVADSGLHELHHGENWYVRIYQCRQVYKGDFEEGTPCPEWPPPPTDPPVAEPSVGGGLHQRPEPDADAVDAYVATKAVRHLGAALTQPVRRSLTDVRQRRTDAEHERVVMLSFPNSGTSYLLQVAACFAGPQQCTAYRAECEATSQGNHVRSCGRGACFLDNGRHARGAPPPLVKWHGLAHGTGDENSYTTSLDALHVKLQRVWDTDTDWPVVGVVRLVRNIFDNLVARHYVECHHKNKMSCPGGRPTRKSFLTRGNGPTGPTLLHDACQYLRWHHRVQRTMLQDARPWTTLTYESLYETPDAYYRDLMRALGITSGSKMAQSPQCKNIVGKFYEPNDMGDLVLKARHAPRRNGYAERIVKRNPGTRVPVYLDMYDAATIVKIDDLVHQYMVDSRNFTSAAMPRCNGFPKA